MIGNILYKAGRTLFKAVGPVHDALDDGVETPVLDSMSIELLEDQDQPVMPGSVANTIYYYVGGTFVVALLVGVLICKAPGLMKKKPKRRTYKRRKPAARRTTRTRKRTYKRRK